MTAQKTEEIRNKIKMHREMIGSLRASLKEAENNSPYGPTKQFYLETMKSITEPLANYNRNVKKYLADPYLFNLEKDINKLQEIVFKTYENYKSYNSEKKIIKRLLKMLKIEKRILANPAYISQSYPDSMNVKETLDEYVNVRAFLNELQDMLKVHHVSTNGIADTPGSTLENVANPV